MEVKTEFLGEMVGELDQPLAVGAGPLGVRLIYNVTGGTFSGPKLRGEALPGGADWALVRSDGVVQLDVRVALKTDDSALIYTYYRGILKISPEVMARVRAGEKVDPAEYYFRTTPVFETGAEKYRWLNQIVAVGLGKIEPSRVIYQVYAVL